MGKVPQVGNSSRLEPQKEIFQTSSRMDIFQTSSRMDRACCDRTGSRRKRVPIGWIGPVVTGPQGLNERPSLR